MSNYEQQQPESVASGISRPVRPPQSKGIVTEILGDVARAILDVPGQRVELLPSKLMRLIEEFQAIEAALAHERQRHRTTLRAEDHLNQRVEQLQEQIAAAHADIERQRNQAEFFKAECDNLAAALRVQEVRAVHRRVDAEMAIGNALRRLGLKGSKFSSALKRAFRELDAAEQSDTTGKGRDA